MASIGTRLWVVRLLADPLKPRRSAVSRSVPTLMCWRIWKLFVDSSSSTWMSLAASIRMLQEHHIRSFAAAVLRTQE